MKLLIVLIILIGALFLFGCTEVQRTYMSNLSACDDMNQLNIGFVVIDENWLDQRPAGELIIIITNQENKQVLEKDLIIKTVDYKTNVFQPGDINMHYYSTSILNREIDVNHGQRMFIYVELRTSTESLKAKTEAYRSQYIGNAYQPTLIHN
jgi:hypothetical protein